MDSGIIKQIPNFVKFGSGIQRLIGGTQRIVIPEAYILQNNGSRLKIKVGV
jgi:hypothetical protein